VVRNVGVRLEVCQGPVESSGAWKCKQRYVPVWFLVRRGQARNGRVKQCKVRLLASFGFACCCEDRFGFWWRTARYYKFPYGEASG